jgi:hypothetical protein
MPPDLPDLRRSSNRNLADDTFEVVTQAKDGNDWRSEVPTVIRNLWPQMSLNERLGVFLMADLSARKAEPVRHLVDMSLSI